MIAKRKSYDEYYINTSIDGLLELIRRKKSIRFDHVLKEMKVDEKTLDAWCSALREAGLIEMDYTFRGLVLKTAKKDVDDNGEEAGKPIVSKKDVSSKNVKKSSHKKPSKKSPKKAAVKRRSPKKSPSKKKRSKPAKRPNGKSHSKKKPTSKKHTKAAKKSSAKKRDQKRRKVGIVRRNINILKRLFSKRKK